MPHDRRLADAAIHVEELREAPVHHEDLPETTDHDVLGLQISMPHTLRMGVRHGVADRDHGVEHAERRPTVRPGVNAPDRGAEIVAADDRHREVEPPDGFDADIVDRQDARMLQAAHHERFVQEARQPMAVPTLDAAAQVQRKDLLREDPPQPRAPDALDHRHTAARDHSEHPKGRDIAKACDVVEGGIHRPSRNRKSGGVVRTGRLVEARHERFRPDEVPVALPPGP